jgi:hypothetical protein
MLSTSLCQNGSTVIWTAIRLTAKFKPHTSCPRLPPCLRSRTLLMSFCDLSWLRASFHDKVTQYGILKAKCNSRVGARLPKLLIVRRNLFCRSCNFRCQMCAANLQAGQAEVIIDLIRVSWTDHLMLALSRPILSSQNPRLSFDRR